MTNPKCSCGAPLVCFSELAGRDKLLSAAKYALDLMTTGAAAETWGRTNAATKLRAAIKLAESRHPVEVAK